MEVKYLYICKSYLFYERKIGVKVTCVVIEGKVVAV